VGSAALVALLVFISIRIYSHGLAAGKEQGQAAQLSIDRQLFTQQLAAYQSQLDAAEKRRQDAEERYVQAVDLAKRLSDSLATLQAQRQAAQTTVAAIPEDKLFTDVTAKLQIRSASDVSPNFYPAELRRIDSVITDYPLLQDSFNKQGEKIAAIEKQVIAVQDQLGAVVTQRDAAIQFGNEMVGHYTKAYNAVPRHRTTMQKVCAVFTLGFGCRVDHIDLPAPVSLRRP
jgi:hypothetical protein